MLGNLALQLTAEVPLAPDVEVGTDVGQAVGQERKLVLALAVDLSHSVTAGKYIVVGVVDAQRARMATLNLGVVAHNLVLAVANVVVVPGTLNLEAVDEVVNCFQICIFVSDYTTLLTMLKQTMLL